MNALSVFGLMPENKAQITSFIQAAKGEILSGQYNPIKVEVQLKIMEELISGLRKDPQVREQLLIELDKYQGKTISIYGTEITKSSRSTLDFSSCNDSELQNLQIEADEINAKVKARQEMLKNIVPMSVVNPITGEYLNPPSKKTTEVITIKIK